MQCLIIINEELTLFVGKACYIGLTTVGLMEKRSLLMVIKKRYAREINCFRVSVTFTPSKYDMIAFLSFDIRLGL